MFVLAMIGFWPFVMTLVALGCAIFLIQHFAPKFPPAIFVVLYVLIGLWIFCWILAAFDAIPYPKALP